MPKMKKCQGLVPRGAAGFKQCEQRAKWIVSYDKEKNFCCDDHITSFLSDKTMNIVLPANK